MEGLFIFIVVSLVSRLLREMQRRESAGGPARGGFGRAQRRMAGWGAGVKDREAPGDAGAPPQANQVSAPSAGVAEDSPAGVEEPYRGSLDHISEEGLTLLYAGMDASEDEARRGEGAAAGPSETAGFDPVSTALAVLRTPEAGGTGGAAVAVVLAEVFGPPRALTPQRVTAPRAHRRGGPRTPPAYPGAAATGA